MASGNKANKKQNKQPQNNKKPFGEKPKQKQKKSSSSCCTWIFGSFLLIGAIAGLLAYDTNAHGGVFAKSATGQFLKQIGALPYVEIAWFKTMSTSARGYQWAEKHVPVYVNTGYVTLKPYADFLRDLSIVGWNALVKGFGQTCDCVKQKTPIVVNFVEQYVPGLPQKISDASVLVWKQVCSTTQYAYVTGSEFFRTKVFVGNLSPENLSKTFNNTQIAAAQYYRWFHKKVDAYAKLQ